MTGCPPILQLCCAAAVVVVDFSDNYFQVVVDEGSKLMGWAVVKNGLAYGAGCSKPWVTGIWCVVQACFAASA